MKVKCINQRNFRNLTLNNEYEVVEQSVDFYHVVNDNGVTARYSKEYFELADLEINQPVVEEVAEEELVEEFEMYVEFAPDGQKERYIIHIDEDNEADLYGELVAGNCGVLSLNGVNDLYDSLDNDLELFEQAIRLLIECAKEYNNKAFLVFSTNYNYPNMCAVLDGIANTTSDCLENPNSDNEIKIWIINLV